LKRLIFYEHGICNIRLSGFPEPGEIEEIIEEYVTSVELLPYSLRVIFIDISGLVHMGARSRQVFSELLIQSSRHYGGNIELVIAGGSMNLRRFIHLFCKGIGFKERSHVFADLDEAQSWIETSSGQKRSLNTTVSLT